MKETLLSVGFMPLADAAPLIVAQEMGFAEEEGIALDLKRAPSWSSLRDMLSFGQVDAAHMLSPVPIAAALGVGGAGAPLSAVSVLSVNGNVIGVCRALEMKLRAAGHDFDFTDAEKAGRALIGVAEGKLRIGVPFPFSMHAELVFYWLAALGYKVPEGVEVRTVPPPLMAEAIAEGEIDAFCVGEPWGTKTVENNVGALLLPCKAIWNFAPEKVLAVRSDWAETETSLTDRLIRAVWRAGRWLGDASSRTLAAEVLARRHYLDLAPELVERALSGRLVISARGEERDVPGFLEFHAGAAGFPWRSQAEWIGRRLASRIGRDPEEAAKAARAVWRSDLYRRALSETGADLPGASSKIEGSLSRRMAVSSASGGLILEADAFFDGRIFEPSEN